VTGRTFIPIVLIVFGLGLLFVALRPTTQEAEPQERTIDLEVRGNTMTPEEISIVEGDSVTLVIIADHPVDFHLHGYDLEEEVETGEPAQLSFEANLTGRFDIEEEQTQSELGTLVVEPRQGG
jgi:Cupredoxin-like domain